MHEVLSRFSAPTAEWFSSTFGQPTAAQIKGWPAIAGDGTPEGREHTLIFAPTGSGKTLTAFLHAIDRLMTDPVPDKTERCRVLYLSPLRALAVDVDKNLRSPLTGIQIAAERLGVNVHTPTVGVRTGDTSQKERAAMKRNPPDILITTPESLYLYLTSQARETLKSVDTIIIDEIHAVAATKRGSHLSLSLERLEELCDVSPQRIGLSATQRPLDEIARFLGGYTETEDAKGRQARPVTIVDAGINKELDLEVIVPVEDMAQLGKPVEEVSDGDFEASAATLRPQRASIWPAMHPRLLDLVVEHTSTLVFVNSRRLAEKLSTSLNELWQERRTAELRAEAHRRGEAPPGPDEDAPEAPYEELVMAHHGSLSRTRRLLIEDRLKSGNLKGLVCTSSLELGIDMGAVDLVVQISSPGSVARGLQRVGRAGHQVGEVSAAKLFPKFRGDLLETAVVVERMRAGAIESTHYPRNPLDVLAQQLVAMAAMDDLHVDDIGRIVRRAAPFADLTDDSLAATLDLLAGRYPSEAFSELRPRVNWDRATDMITGRKGAQRLAVTNPGTIPDRGLFGVFLPDGTRVGELDEEMVYESRPGEVFLLGASTWRIEDITYERVVVTPAPGEPAKLPFWHGDGPGRPAELGQAIGAFIRTTSALDEKDPEAARDKLIADHALDGWSAANLLGYLREQKEATGALPDDQTILIERFRDDLGDWKVCIHSPWGTPVNAPWAMAIEKALLDRDIDPEVLWSDDGIVLRIQEAIDDLPLEVFTPSPDEIDDIVTDTLAGTAMFTTLFREAAGRALLLPKRRPDQRTALWQQRMRAANLLQVAREHPQFPIVLEATREALQDVFDLPATRDLLQALQERRIRIEAVETDASSPMAQSMLFAWVGQYMYEYDAPLAERRAAALALDRNLLRQLLGDDALRELLDADAIADLEAELQWLPESRQARDADDITDLLRALGPVTRDELRARTAVDRFDDDALDQALGQLHKDRRIITITIAGEERLAASDDAGRLRDALGAQLPVGLPSVFTDPVPTALSDLVHRYARTHGPFTPREIARRLGAPLDRIEHAIDTLTTSGVLLNGEFRPDGTTMEWCDATVLRRIRSRSLAKLRSDVEPVSHQALARFLPMWHGITSTDGTPGGRRGLDALWDAVSQLRGAPIPASVLERDILPARVRGYDPSMLDELFAAGDLLWVGVESLGQRDGRIMLLTRDDSATWQSLIPQPRALDEEKNAQAQAIVQVLRERGASFWADISSLVRAEDATSDLHHALWDAVWAGHVTNDTFLPVRNLLTPQGKARRGRKPRRVRGRPRGVGRSSTGGRWSLVPLPPDDPTREAARATTMAAMRAEVLLERHGVVTRDVALGESVPGGFATVYPVYKALEERGKVRRGYIIDGMGGAQFARPGAIESLRALRDDAADARPARKTTAVILAATDPAQPFGATLPWPASAGRPARTAGSHVILRDGHPIAHLARGGKALSTFGVLDAEGTAADGPLPAADVGSWITALQALLDDNRYRRIQLEKIDGAPAAEHAIAPALLEHGFVRTPQGLTLHG